HLAEFRRFLESRFVCDYFGSAAELQASLLRSLADLEKHEVPTGVRKQWAPRVAHALQPSPEFSGREEVLGLLSAWIADPNHADRVVALVGGRAAGKTAITERFFSTLAAQGNSGVLVWSFYENPEVEAFFREACRYFAAPPEGAGGLLESL